LSVYRNHPIVSLKVPRVESSGNWLAGSDCGATIHSSNSAPQWPSQRFNFLHIATSKWSKHVSTVENWAALGGQWRGSRSRWPQRVHSTRTACVAPWLVSLLRFTARSQYLRPSFSLGRDRASDSRANLNWTQHKFAPKNALFSSRGWSDGGERGTIIYTETACCSYAFYYWTAWIRCPSKPNERLPTGRCCCAVWRARNNIFFVFNKFMFST